MQLTQREQLLTALAGAFILLVPPAHAATRSYPDNPASSYYISAPVVQVDPITTQRTVSTPVRQCTRPSSPPRYNSGYRGRSSYSHDYDHRYERRRSEENYFLPGLFGGIVGGLIGNQFGGGSGKKALTIVGALAGSSIARDAARQRHRPAQPEAFCHTRYESEIVEEVSAYDVTYEYGGQHFNKRMTEHPGDSVRVRIELTPDRP
jgi:uncharacterized protein YcfJ